MLASLFSGNRCATERTRALDRRGWGIKGARRRSWRSRTIEDVTPLVTEIHGLARAGQLESAAGLLPEERPLDLDDEVLAPLRA